MMYNTVTKAHENCEDTTKVRSVVKGVVNPLVLHL